MVPCNINDLSFLSPPSSLHLSQGTYLLKYQGKPLTGVRYYSGDSALVMATNCKCLFGCHAPQNYPNIMSKKICGTSVHTHFYIDHGNPP